MPAMRVSPKPSLPAAEPRLPRGKDFNGKPFNGLHFTPSAGDLFVGGASSRDVAQGNLGDCFFLASLAAVARLKPSLVKNAVRANKDGTFTVTFQQHTRGGTKPVEITVDGTLPADAEGRRTFGRSTTRSERWPAIYEKAFASFKGGYDRLDKGGYANEVLTHLTGKPARKVDLGKLSGAKLWSALSAADRAGQPMVSGTPGLAALRRATGRKDQGGLLDDHDYAVVGLQQRSGEKFVELYTPLTPSEGGGRAWDKRRTLELPFELYRKAFDELTIGMV